MSSFNLDRILTPAEDARKIWNALAASHFATAQAEEIFKEILPEVLARFLRKNADYGDTATFLGAKGQFADINPKFWKLKRALWDGEELHGESVEKILSDLVGHCLLTLYFLREDAEPDDEKGLESYYAKPIAP